VSPIIKRHGSPSRRPESPRRRPRSPPSGQSNVDRKGFSPDRGYERRPYSPDPRHRARSAERLVLGHESRPYSPDHRQQKSPRDRRSPVPHSPGRRGYASPSRGRRPRTPPYSPGRRARTPESRRHSPERDRRPHSPGREVLIEIGDPGVLKGGLTAQPEEDLALHLIIGTGACLTPPYLMLILQGKCLLLHFIININSSHPWLPQHTQDTLTHLKDFLLMKGWRGSTVSRLNMSKLLPWTSVVLPQGFLVFNLIIPLLCHLVGPNNMQHHCHSVRDCQP